MSAVAWGIDALKPRAALEVLGLLALLAGVLPRAAHGAELVVRVAGDGGPVGDAVVSMHSPAAAAAVRPGAETIDQRDAQFVPLVTATTVGSRVHFPNTDDIRHQVYSFSPTKRFELPLYHGTRASPVVFDRPGIVEMGCNIHDWMVAYLVILDTPYHAVSDKSGRAAMDLPAGRYAMRVWHPHLRGGYQESQVEVGAGPMNRNVTLELAAPIGPARPADEKLRALQEKFRKLKRDK